MLLPYNDFFKANFMTKCEIRYSNTKFIIFIIKVIVYSYLILKKMNECIADS